jgi:hypothetical protein
MKKVIIVTVKKLQEIIRLVFFHRAVFNQIRQLYLILGLGPFANNDFQVLGRGRRLHILLPCQFNGGSVASLNGFDGLAA